MAKKFSNAARAELAASITDIATSLTITSGGSSFPIADTGNSAISDAADWFKLVIQDQTGIEIVYVRTHTSGSNTFSDLLRGQEGTTARAFTAPCIVGMRMTAADAGDWEAAREWGDHAQVGYLTSHQAIKTLHSKTLTGSGDVTLTASDVGAAPASTTLTDAAASSTLPTISSSTLVSLLQTIRDNLKWAFANLVPTTRKVNGKPLSGDITLTAADVGATNNTGTVTSVGLTAPTGLTVTGSPVTSSGTLTMSYTSGYSIPTTAKQGNWDTAYGWGDHAQVGYLTSHQAIKTLHSKTLTGSGNVTLDKTDIGLGNVDNTADANKTVASAGKLTSAVNVGGVSFDGSASIDLPGVNKEGNQNTSGNAATATALKTARTFSITGDMTATGVSFDGTGNVTLTATSNVSVSDATTTTKGIAKIAPDSLGDSIDDDTTIITPKHIGVITGMRGYSVQQSVSFTQSSNQISSTDLVTKLGLEIGDVIWVEGTANNDNMYTVEAIANASNFTVNYEHRNNRGGLTLTNETVSCYITLASKWFEASLGQGQGWVLIPGIQRNTSRLNATGRTIQVCVYLEGSATGDPWISALIEGLGSAGGGGGYINSFAVGGSIMAVVPNGDSYSLAIYTWEKLSPNINNAVDGWFELR